MGKRWSLSSHSYHLLLLARGCTRGMLKRIRFCPAGTGSASLSSSVEGASTSAGMCSSSRSVGLGRGGGSLRALIRSNFAGTDPTSVTGLLCLTLALQAVTKSCLALSRTSNHLCLLIVIKPSAVSLISSFSVHRGRLPSCCCQRTRFVSSCVESLLSYPDPRQCADDKRRMCWVNLFLLVLALLMSSDRLRNCRTWSSGDRFWWILISVFHALYYC